MSVHTPISLLQGTRNIPDGILVSQLVSNRAKEIQELEKLAAQTTGTKLVFQKLPRHLRRRPMSHNVNRLPRHLREAHLNQMKKSGLPAKIKRPSRKFKRRPTNLLQDYNRRQKQNVWLETHIWHAKRFKMINLWGYRLPFKPNDKAFRACYRASAYHCLLQDISYISCIEITGLKTTIINQFKLITSPSTDLTIGAQAFITGNREGDIVVYQKNCYPFGAIGQIKFMWKAEEQDDELGCLWLWIHPAFYDEIINTLINIFDLQETVNSDNKNFVNQQTNTKLTELRQSLNRFRLTGPLAHSIIKKLEVPSEANVTPWFQEYLQIPRHKIIFNEQVSYWKELNKINTTAELSPRLIVNLTVTDPRYSLPAKRTKAVKQNNTDDEDYPVISKDIKFGAIWSDKIKTEISKNVLNTSEYIEKQKKQKYLVPPDNLPLDAPVLPVMLVQQPGKKDNTGYSSGWDIILPSNWGRPFWFNFIMWGGRAGGVKESNLIQFEQGMPDLLYPDTKAGETEENRITELRKAKYFSLPPNKRINYTKYGISCPFNFDWKTLIREWNQQVKVDNFYVLRDKSELKLLQIMLNNKNIVTFEGIFNENCLIPVKLLLNNGKVNKFSIICLPKDDDYKNIPIEPVHEDENQTTRKDMRNQHQKMLRKMKKERIFARKIGQQPPSSKQIIEEQLEKMKSLWLPETKCVRKSCSREIIGFVTNGDFSLSAGKGQCVGYIALGALPHIFNKQIKDTVLVRDTKNKQYKLAKMEIICT